MNPQELAKKYGATYAPPAPTADPVALAQKYGATYTPAPESKPAVKTSNLEDPGSFFAPAPTKSRIDPATGKMVQDIRIRDAARELGNSFASSEMGLGESIAAGASSFLPKSVTGVGDLEKAQKTNADSLNQFTDLIRKRRASGLDTTHAENSLRQFINSAPKTDLADLYPALNKTTLQVLGEIGGTALDVLLAGTYGEATAGMRAGELATKKVLPTIATQSADLLTKKIPAVGTKELPKLGEILRTGTKNILKGAGIGEVIDVNQNLREGKTGPDILTSGAGKYFGGLIPLALTGEQATILAGRKVAPSFVNSLLGATTEFNRAVKFGHNPGEAVVKYGITANSLPELEQKTSQARNEIGEIIGNHYNLPENATKRQSFADAMNPIDEAIAKAQQAPETNASLIERLQRAKRDIMTGQKLEDMNPAEGFKLKQKVKSIMKFTGAPSDDKGVNGALNGVYGRITEKLNRAVPELVDLNKDYGGLSAAELAAETREQRNLGKNMISLPAKIFGGAGAVAGALTGGLTVIPTLIGSAVGVGLEKLFSTTAVKTRIADFLGGATDGEIQALLRQKNIRDQKTIIDNFNRIIEEQRLNRPLLPAPAPRLPANGTPAMTDASANTVGGMRQRLAPEPQALRSDTTINPERIAQGRDRGVKGIGEQYYPSSGELPVIQTGPKPKSPKSDLPIIEGKTTIGTLLGLAGATAGLAKNNKPTATVEEPIKQDVAAKVRGVDVTPRGSNLLRHTLFGELSNGGLPQQQKEEARQIVNTAINRVIRKGKTLEEILTEPNAYKGLHNNQSKQLDNGVLDYPSQNKVDLVDEVIAELINGDFKDNTDGAMFYSHKDGKLILDHKDIFLKKPKPRMPNKPKRLK